MPEINSVCREALPSDVKEEHQVGIVVQKVPHIFCLSVQTGVSLTLNFKSRLCGNSSVSNQRKLSGCDIVDAGDVNEFDIELTLKEKGTVLGCSRHANQDRRFVWLVIREDK